MNKIFVAYSELEALVLINSARCKLVFSLNYFKNVTGRDYQKSEKKDRASKTIWEAASNYIVGKRVGPGLAFRGREVRFV